MLTITPIPAFQDNYIWLLQAGEHVACVDTGDAAPVLAYLQQHRLQLSQIWLTHRIMTTQGAWQNYYKPFLTVRCMAMTILPMPPIAYKKAA